MKKRFEIALLCTAIVANALQAYKTFREIQEYKKQEKLHNARRRLTAEFQKRAADMDS